MIRAKTILTALALVALTAAGDARAAFTYSVAPLSTTTAIGSSGLSSMTVAAANNGLPSNTLSGTQIISIAQITQNSSLVVGPGVLTDSGNVLLAPLMVTIRNIGTNQTGTFTVNGTIVVTRSDTQGASSFFTPGVITPATITLGNLTYSLSSPTYTAPTINSGAPSKGGLSILISEVPEPTSVALMGMGLATLGALAYRRRVARA